MRNTPFDFASDYQSGMINNGGNLNNRNRKERYLTKPTSSDEALIVQGVTV